MCNQVFTDKQGSDTEQQGEQTKIQRGSVFASQYEQQQMIDANYQQACGYEHFSSDFQIGPNRQHIAAAQLNILSDTASLMMEVSYLHH
ncbi:hypothetical protein D3C81_1947110 [compost metagenome]